MDDKEKLKKLRRILIAKPHIGNRGYIESAIEVLEKKISEEKEKR